MGCQLASPERSSATESFIAFEYLERAVDRQRFNGVGPGQWL